MNRIEQELIRICEIVQSFSPRTHAVTVSLFRTGLAWGMFIRESDMMITHPCLLELLTTALVDHRGVRGIVTDDHAELETLLASTCEAQQSAAPRLAFAYQGLMIGYPKGRWWIEGVGGPIEKPYRVWMHGNEGENLLRTLELLRAFPGWIGNHCITVRP